MQALHSEKVVKLHPDFVIKKTELGDFASKKPHSTLPGALLTLLKVVNGRSTVRTYVASAQMLGNVQMSLEKLLALGYVDVDWSRPKPERVADNTATKASAGAHLHDGAHQQADKQRLASAIELMVDFVMGQKMVNETDVMMALGCVRSLRELRDKIPSYGRLFPQDNLAVTLHLVALTRLAFDQ